ncbi:hypothetical protein KUV69_10080 [Pseudooceanicola nitratireducens]|nr:hypothetical protein [Pseudooceanicola nitratireducens]
MRTVIEVRVLSQDETVRLDPDRLQALYDQLGEAGAEDVVCRAMEELAVRLSMTERFFRQDRLDDMRKAARSLTGIAEQIGMNCLARVAGDVTACIDCRDAVALSATLSRLLRIGERSLTVIWDMQNVQV